MIGAVTMKSHPGLALPVWEDVRVWLTCRGSGRTDPPSHDNPNGQGCRSTTRGHDRSALDAEDLTKPQGSTDDCSVTAREVAEVRA